MIYPFKDNPIRLRSKRILLIYYTNITVENIKLQLFDIFQIKNDQELEYYIKKEFYNKNKVKIFVYFQFKSKYDMYSSKLSIKNNNMKIEGEYWALDNNVSLGLRYLFQSIKKNENNVITNINTEIIKPLESILYDGTVQNNGDLVYDEDTFFINTPINKKLAGRKQMDLFEKHKGNFDAEYSKKNKDISKLQSIIGNFYNLQKYQWSLEYDIEFKRYKKKLSDLKKERKKK